jgi:putative DNA primase/helicase
MNTCTSNLADVVKLCLKHLPEDEAGDAQVLMRILKDKFVYDHSSGTWYCFRNHIWLPDAVKSIVMAVDDLVEVYQAIHHVLTSTPMIPPEWNLSAKPTMAEIAELERRIKRLGASRRRENVVRLASCGRDRVGISGSEWERDPWILPCENGVVDLRTGQLRPGVPEDYYRLACPTVWTGLDTDAPTWKKFLEDVFAGNQDIIAFLQRFLGSALIGKVVTRSLPIFYGVGSNGKSTLLETLKAVVGPFAEPIPRHLLLQTSRERSSGAPAPEVLDLQGKRLVWASELEESEILATARVKHLTGNDSLAGRPLYSNTTIRFTPSHSIILQTNHKPRVDGGDPALWDRILLVPFDIRFVPDPKEPHERKQDPGIREALLEERSGILAWLVRGTQVFLANNQQLDAPLIVQAATAEYKLDEDEVSQFIENCVVKGAGQILVLKLYQTYERWCGSLQLRPLGQRRFIDRVRYRLGTQKRTSAGYVFEGYELNERGNVLLKNFQIEPRNQ